MSKFLAASFFLCAGVVLMFVLRRTLNSGIVRIRGGGVVQKEARPVAFWFCVALQGCLGLALLSFGLVALTLAIREQ